MTAFVQHIKTLRQILGLPVACLHFDSSIDPRDIPTTYRSFTRPHPKYKIIRHKSVGVALLDLDRYPDPAAYFAAIQGKNRGAYHAKRARARGYVCQPIERNRHIDAIHAINTSLDVRQGRPMDAKYTEQVTSFDTRPHFDYLGVLNGDGKLVAYANIGRYGNFSAFSQLLGLRNNDGIMHLLVVEIVSRLIEQKRVRYVMYDTFFGAQPGLQQFKRVLGFEPYRAKYSLQ